MGLADTILNKFAENPVGGYVEAAQQNSSGFAVFPISGRNPPEGVLIGGDHKQPGAMGTVCRISNDVRDEPPPKGALIGGVYRKAHVPYI